MKNWSILIFIILLYLLKLYFVNPEIFTYRFNKNSINQYFCSQDIPREVPCKRVFLSDGDLHIAAGYLYVNGYDPSQYHFQHAPLIKYLYGLIILLFNNPYYLEIMFVILYLIISYILIWKVYESHAIAILTCLFMSLGPLLRTLSGDASFDVGQAVFMLTYGILVLYKPKNFLLQGLFLGLFASAKFWGAVPFFIIVFNGYNLLKRQFSFKLFVLQLLIAFLVFTSTYTVTFINTRGNFNLILFQFKVLKYWLDHSTASLPFSSLILFLSGYYKSWWDTQEITKGEVWNILWPLSFIISFLKIRSDIVNKQVTKKTLFAFIPVAYLFYLSPQTPYVRYFILILPFFYAVSTEFIINNFSKKNSALKKKKIR